MSNESYCQHATPSLTCCLLRPDHLMLQTRCCVSGPRSGNVPVPCECSAWNLATRSVSASHRTHAQIRHRLRKLCCSTRVSPPLSRGTKREIQVLPLQRSQAAAFLVLECEWVITIIERVFVVCFHHSKTDHSFALPKSRKCRHTCHKHASCHSYVVPMIC